jgi:hypothetical protein
MAGTRARRAGRALGRLGAGHTRAEVELGVALLGLADVVCELVAGGTGGGA